MVNKDFIFNNKLFIDSNILVSRENFGCGSSREHAVWALKDFGIKQSSQNHLLIFFIIIALRMVS